jgi:bifunctional UDP-N-acetylglucosamine pyrophosphorylase/glucosamine-1-phosphate N-acetyltransferase
MQAVILAGGIGKRLRPITEMVPKPLVQVGGRPILDYILDALPSAVREIILVVNYKEEMLRDYVGTSSRGRLVYYVKQSEPRGTGHAVFCAGKLVRERFLLLMGDDIYSPASLNTLTQRQAAVLAREVENPRPFGVLRLDSKGLVSEIVEKPAQPPSRLVSCGAFVLPAEVTKIRVPPSPRGEIEVTDMVNVLIARGLRLNPVKTDFWLPANTPDEVKRAEEAIWQLNPAPLAKNYVIFSKKLRNFKKRIT